MRPPVHSVSAEQRLSVPILTRPIVKELQLPRRERERGRGREGGRESKEGEGVDRERMRKEEEGKEWRKLYIGKVNE